jgi:nuclear GTP-binding protein
MVKEDHEKEEAGKARMRKEAQSLAQLASNAGGSLAEYEKKQKGSHQQIHSNLIPQNERDSSRKAFFREFKKVVEEADVILEVLDARDPIGCRARAVEQAILAKGDKKIVLVLNKIDLVPRQVVTAWLKHLRQEFPTVAFRCNTQLQKSNLARGKGDFDTYDSLAGGTCLGGDNLLELLKNYCRSQNLKKTITVGIIGYPNTGKSSLINSLKRSKAAAVGAKPGFTRTMQVCIVAWLLFFFFFFFFFQGNQAGHECCFVGLSWNCF